jgi:hypothetical protein
MKQTLINLCGAALLAMSLATGANAATYHTLEKAMFSGGTLELNHYAQINVNCSSRGRVEVRILSGPSSGSVKLVQKMGSAKFSGDYEQCSTHLVPGTTVVYRPQTGYTGSDSVQLDVISPTGLEFIDTYNITVK